MFAERALGDLVSSVVLQIFPQAFLVINMAPMASQLNNMVIIRKLTKANGALSGFNPFEIVKFVETLRSFLGLCKSRTSLLCDDKFLYLTF